MKGALTAAPDVQYPYFAYGVTLLYSPGRMHVLPGTTVIVQPSEQNSSVQSWRTVSVPFLLHSVLRQKINNN